MQPNSSGEARPFRHLKVPAVQLGPFGAEQTWSTQAADEEDRCWHSTCHGRVSTFSRALAGAGAALAVQHLVLWYNNRQLAAALWLGALSASLAAQMGVTAWVLKAPPDQFNGAMFVRVVLNALAIVLFVPTAAAFSGRTWPRWSMGLLIAVARDLCGPVGHDRPRVRTPALP